MVFEHQGSYETQAAAIAAIAPKIGCIPQTLCGWVMQAEKDSGMRDGVTTDEPSHGLRKACATRLAEAGASEREIMAWTGHTSPKMVQIYAGKARRGLLADHGFEKLIKNETGSELDEPNTKGSTK